MKILKVKYSSIFVKELKRLSPQKQQLAIEREKLFKKDPFSQKLKTHKLSGKLQGFWAFSINYQDRIMFKFISDTEVVFYKIGSHDIYK